jgi:hypothetical protein
VYAQYKIKFLRNDVHGCLVIFPKRIELVLSERRHILILFLKSIKATIGKRFAVILTLRIHNI